MEKANMIADVLERVLEDLQHADELLNEVDTIGLWSRSDDCSDNRRKRAALRETDWAVAGAARRVAALSSQVPPAQAVLDGLATDLQALVVFLEPLPDMVTDIMATNPELDRQISAAQAEIARLRERAEQLRRASGATGERPV